MWHVFQMPLHCCYFPRLRFHVWSECVKRLVVKTEAEGESAVHFSDSENLLLSKCTWKSTEARRPLVFYSFPVLCLLYLNTFSPFTFFPCRVLFFLAHIRHLHWMKRDDHWMQCTKTFLTQHHVDLRRTVVLHHLFGWWYLMGHKIIDTIDLDIYPLGKDWRVRSLLTVCWLWLVYIGSVCFFCIITGSLKIKNNNNNCST